MRLFQIYIDGCAKQLEPVYDREPMKILKNNSADPYVDWPGLRLQDMGVDEHAETQDPFFADFTAVGMASETPLCTTAVQETLKTICGVTGQWLDVTFTDKDYALLNLTHVVDALDFERSTKKYFKSTGRLGGFPRYAFHLEAVKNEWLFREKAWPYSLFCTEHFASLVEKEGWTGLRLRPVWDSNHEPFMDFPTKTEIHTRPDVFGPDGFVNGFEHVWPDEWHRGEIPDVKS